MDNFIYLKRVSDFWCEVSVCCPGWPQIWNPPASAPGSWVYGCIPIVPDFLIFFIEVNLQLCSFDPLFLNMWHSPFLCFLFTVSEKFLFLCISLPFSTRHLNILIVIILKGFSTNSYISYLWVHWSVFFSNLRVTLPFLKEYLMNLRMRE